MKQNNVWVVGNKKSGFFVRVEGEEHPRSKHKTQKAAITEGRLLAIQNQSELIVQDMSGKIRSKDSYGSESPVKDQEN